MSSRSLPVRLSKKARQDLVEILRYTEQTWGAQQLEIYRDKIDDALRAIGCHPELGHQRQDLPTTHRAYLVGAHVVVYRIENQGIGIVRILHQRMSLALWVPGK